MFVCLSFFYLSISVTLDCLKMQIERSKYNFISSSNGFTFVTHILSSYSLRIPQTSTLEYSDQPCRVSTWSWLYCVTSIINEPTDKIDTHLHPLYRFNTLLKYKIWTFKHQLSETKNEEEGKIKLNVLTWLKCLEAEIICMTWNFSLRSVFMLLGKFFDRNNINKLVRLQWQKLPPQCLLWFFFIFFFQCLILRTIY